MFGEDPNWGRIICAVGNAGVNLNPQNVSLTIQGTTVFKQMSKAAYSIAALSRKMKEKNINLVIHLNQGKENFLGFFSDLSYDYVKINSQYTT